MNNNEEVSSESLRQQMMDWVIDASLTTIDCVNKALRSALAKDFKTAAISALQARNRAQMTFHYMAKQIGGELDQSGTVANKIDEKTQRAWAELSAVVWMDENDFGDYIRNMGSERAERLRAAKRAMTTFIESTEENDQPG